MLKIYRLFLYLIKKKLSTYIACISNTLALVNSGKKVFFFFLIN